MDKVGRFYHNKIFEIPSQQRPYSWGSEQIKALLSDLNLAIRRSEEHYCGPVFLEKSKGDDGNDKPVTVTGIPDNLVHWDVLDGQQRITSLMLVAAAIANDEDILQARDMGMTKSLTIRDKLMDLYSYVSAEDGDYDTSRLIFNDGDMDLMMKHLLFNNPPQIAENQLVKASMRRLKENYVYVTENFTQLCSITDAPTNKDEWFSYVSTKIKIGQKFLDALKIEQVEMDAHGFNKYTVFEAINNRGLNLSQFDMIKNLCLHIADQHEKRCENNQVPPAITKDIIINNWYSTLSHLFLYELEKNETRTISDLWSVLYNVPSPNKDEVFAEFKKKFYTLVDTDSNQKMNQLINFCNNWAPYTEAYCKIYTDNVTYKFNLANMTFGAKKNLDRMLYKIGLPDEFRRPLTSAFNCYEPADFERFSEFMEKALFRIHATKIHRNLTKCRPEFTTLSQAIFVDNIDIDESLRRLCTIITEGASLKSLIDHLTSGYNAYSGWREHSLYYFIYRIDNERSPNAVAYEEDIVGRKQQREHIMPQKHSAHWSTSWPNVDTREKWLHRLGNLTLTEGNASNVALLNYDIQNKCDTNPTYTYRTGRFVEREVYRIAGMYTNSKRWQKLEIITHELSYCKYLIKLWGLPCDCDMEEIPIDGNLLTEIESLYEMLKEDFQEDIEEKFNAQDDIESLDEFKESYLEEVFGEESVLRQIYTELISNFSPEEITDYTPEEIIECNPTVDEEE
jgi:hypothetical protein